MNTFLWKYTISKMKTNKRNTIVLLLFSLFMMMSLCMGTILNLSFHKIKQEEKIDNHGSWIICYHNADTKKWYHLMKETPEYFYDDFEYSIINVIDVNEEIEYLASIKGDFERLSGYHLIKGSWNIQDNQVIVTRQYLKNHSLKEELNQNIQYNNHTYIIKGIVNSNQETDLFPSIIVNNNSHIQYSHILTNEKCNELLYNHTLSKDVFTYSDITTNWGDDASNYGEYHMNQVYEVTGLQVEIFLIILVITIGFIQMMINTQTREFVLLRGIGTTKKQLTIMSFIEIFFINIITIPLSIVLSSFLSYLIISLYTMLGHPFYFINDISYLLMNILLGFLGFTLCFIIPHRNAYTKALSGAFDGEKFKVISFRSHKLKKQNLFQISKKSLVSNGKLNVLLAMIIIVIMASGSFIINFPNERYDYLQNIDKVKEYRYMSLNNTKDELDKVQDQLSLDAPSLYLSTMELDDKDCYYQNDKGKYYPSSYHVSTIYHNQVLNKDNIEGRLPKNDDEVFISNMNYDFYLSVDKINEDGHIYSDTSDTVEIKLGDEIYIQDHKFKIVGFENHTKTHIHDLSVYYTGYLSPSQLVVSENAFLKLKGAKESFLEYYISTADQKKKLIYHINQFSNQTKIENHFDQSNDYIYFLDNYHSLTEEADQQSIKILLGDSVFFGLFAILTIFQTQRENKNYQLLQLIGVTKKELIIIQLYKALICTLYGAIICFFTSFIITLAYVHLPINYIGCILWIIFIFIFTFLCYVVSMIPIMKQRLNISDLSKGE